jgi:uncharacterized membrane protein YdjX (TVP38/TMEM64 family)
VKHEEKKAQPPKGYRMGGRFQKVGFAFLGGLVLLVVGGYVLWLTGVLSDVYQEYEHLIRLYADPQQLRAMVLSYGNLAPLVFILLQVTQVVFSFIPGEATGFLGGFLFGTFRGFVYSSIGVSLGSLLAFGLARWLGLRFVKRIVQPSLYQKFAFLEEPRGILVVFLLFLIPGFPKDTLSYILGVTPIHFWVFFFVMSIGRMPGTGLLSIQGAKFQAESDSWILFAVIGGVLLLMVYLYWNEMIEFIRGRRAGSR